MHLNELLTIVGRPKYVKVAAEQPARAYGAESAEDVYLGYVTSMAGGQDTTKWAQLARFWQIGEDVKTAQEAWEADQVPGQIPEEAYALSQELDGRKVRKYAAVDAQSTLEAADAFYENRWRYPYGWRKQAAANLLIKAASYEVELPEGVARYLHQAVGLGLPSEESIEGAVMARYRAAGHLAGFEKLASALHTIAVNPELRVDREVVKVALQAMEDFDLQVTYRDPSQRLLPETILDVLDDDLVKCASTMVSDHAELTNGQTVKISELAQDVLAAVSPELAGMSHEELRDVLPTLPRPDADLLIRLSA